MQALIAPLTELAEFETVLKKRKQETGILQFAGCVNSQKTHMMYALGDGFDYKIIAVSSEMKAKQIYEEYRFLDSDIYQYPAKDLLFYQADLRGKYLLKQRMEVFQAILEDRGATIVTSFDGFMDALLPLELMRERIRNFKVGDVVDFEAIKKDMVLLGYDREEQIEGPGQFAVRGGILDIFSPAADRPFRAEFFGDELDTIGFFDPDTQRRTENTDLVMILPVGETQPMLHPYGIDGLCSDISALIQRQRRRKNINQALIKTLEQDLEKYQNSMSNPASDRYMAYIYPEMATAMDYIPENAVILLCDQSSLHRRARTRTEEMGLQLDSLLQGGSVAGELCEFVCQWEDFCDSLTGRTVVYLDSFGGSSYPETCPPKQLLPMVAKQLPGYGGNLDTAASASSRWSSDTVPCSAINSRMLRPFSKCSLCN